MSEMRGKTLQKQLCIELTNKQKVWVFEQKIKA